MSGVDLIAMLASELNISAVQISLVPVAGGDINDSFVLQQNNTNICFVKSNTNSRVLESEYRSLLRIKTLGATCFPEALGFWEIDSGGAILILEYLPLRSVGNEDAEALAETLFNLHEIKAEDFGWFEDGMIGQSEQINQRSLDWADFFISRRIEPQLRMAQVNGLKNSLVERIKDKSDEASEFLAQQETVPCLLHGDLWAGNVAVNTATGSPVLFDPAPYFGDVMTDLSMARLFGGFPPSFFRFYSQQSRNREQDRMLRSSKVSLERYYNLYHALKF